MILTNVAVPISVAGVALGGTPHGQCLHGDLHLSAPGSDRPNHMTLGDPAKSTRMVLPRLTEAHCHLDKCHSINRLGPVGGDLPQAIAAQDDDRPNWTEDDLRTRMTRGLKEAQAAGCGALRSHIDWGDSPGPPIAWHVFDDLMQDSDMTLQRSVLTGIDTFADPDFCAAVAGHVAAARGGVLGAFVHQHDSREAGLENIFAQAVHHGLLLDFHVDETLDDLKGLEAIADMAVRFRFEAPILCGHACNLMNLHGRPLERLIEKLLKTRISVCALPTTNLYLQGRTDGTPDRRGITRLHELDQAGVPILLASDNVADAFCPVGQHDPMAALHLGVLGAHLDPPFDRWLPTITQNAHRALGLADVTVAQARSCDLVMSNATSLAYLISGRHGSLSRIRDEQASA